MANNSNSERWYFSRDQIRSSPSVKDGIEHGKELGYRQQCANLIQDIGQRLQVPQLVINTAIVYMHRFYMLHSFSTFKRNTMGPCFIFLAAKVEEHPRRLEHVLKMTHLCLNKDGPAFDSKSDDYMKVQQELVDNESVLLQTLGFEVAVDHPNTYVVKCVQLVKASKELAQTAYFLATNSLHLTAFCIEYKPTVVACVCIYVACLWAHYVIPETESKNWYEFIDNTVTKKMLEDLGAYFIKILDSCPTRLKKRLTCGGAMVYKEGKVVAKKESGTSDDAKEASCSKASTNTEESEKNSDEGKPSVKTHLKGLLKPQPHDSTPPPCRGIASSKVVHHQKKHHEHRSSSSELQKKMAQAATHSQQHQDQRKVDSPHVNEARVSEARVSEAKVKEARFTEASPKTSTSKTHEQSKIDQRKKWTPQQVEEYRKRKEKEKLLLQRKRDADRNERDPATGKPLNASKVEDASGRLKRPHADSGSPMKRQRTDVHAPKSSSYPECTTMERVNHGSDEKLNNEITNFHRMTKESSMFTSENQRNTTLSSSGSDSETPHNTSNTANSSLHKKTKSYHSMNLNKHNLEQKAPIDGAINPLPPPPPPPRFSTGNINSTSLTHAHSHAHPSSATTKINIRNHSNQKQFSTPPKFV